MKDKVAEVAFYVMLWIVGICILLSLTKDKAHTISTFGTFIYIVVWAAILAVGYWCVSGRSLFSLTDYTRHNRKLKC